MSKKLNIANITSDLEGSAFFPSKSTPSPSPALKQPQNKQRVEVKKPAKPQTALPTKQPSSNNQIERAEKYTTRLKPSLVKKIRLEAVELDIKDYEVVTNAVNAYFEKKR